MCQSRCENRTILKYASDPVIVSRLQDNETSHGPVINDLVKWCEESCLQLNKSKTKEMIADFKTHAHTHEATSIKAEVGNFYENVF